MVEGQLEILRTPALNHNPAQREATVLHGTEESCSFGKLLQHSMINFSDSAVSPTVLTAKFRKSGLFSSSDYRIRRRIIPG